MSYRPLAAAILTAGLALTAPALAADDLSRKTRNQIEKAEDKLESGDAAGALALIDSRLEASRLSELDRAALLVARAEIRLESGDRAGAEADLKASLGVAGAPSWQRDETVLVLGELYADDGRAEEALELLQSYADANGASGDLLDMIRELELATGRLIPTDLADRPVKPISTRAPRFPAGCSRGAAEYRVQVQFDVTAAGVVEDVEVVSSSDPCLEAAAVTAVSSWTFDPAVQSGYFVETRDIPVTVTFN